MIISIPTCGLSFIISITTAKGFGDPHYTTFDGKRFDFNGMGDFILMEALSDDGTPVFTLQGRMRTIPPWPRTTTHSGLAFGYSELAFHVRKEYNLRHSIRKIDYNYIVSGFFCFPSMANKTNGYTC